MKKILKLMLLLFFLFWWLVLSPVSFPDDKDSDYIYSSDNNWKLVLSPVLITNPISLIQWFENKKYIVLFDKDGNYIGQSSPICLMRFDEFDEYDVFFPSKSHAKLLFLPEDCDYTIPIGEKRWWSKIIGFINY